MLAAFDKLIVRSNIDMAIGAGELARTVPVSACRACLTTKNILRIRFISNLSAFDST